MAAANGFAMGDMPSGNSVWGSVLRQHGFYRYNLPETCPACYTFGDFAADHPQGTFVLGTGTHVVAMAEYVYNPVQRVEPNQNVLLQDAIPCNRGYVIHRNGSGILTLRGIVNGSCGCFARYQVTFNGNIAIPSDGTAPAPISVSLAIDG